MAQRDRSQGFGFVYVDIAKLLAGRKEWQKDGAPILPSEDTKVINFNKDPEAPALDTAPASASAPTPAAAQDRVSAIQQIRHNLDRLQSLHHKLHAMLEELNHLTGEKKKV